MAERFSTQWDLRFLEMAKLVSGWSKDPSTKCGAVIVRPDKTVASVGFNGFPKGCDDDPAIYADRERKLSRVVHAEQNALLHAGESVDGYSMFTWPPGFGPSCDRCTAHVIQAGIKSVVYVKDTSPDFASRWKEAVESGLEMYREAGVEVAHYNIADLEGPMTLEMGFTPEQVEEHVVLPGMSAS
jgi:dCMP deaminase